MNCFCYLFSFLLLFITCGCASVPYRYGTNRSYGKYPTMKSGEPQFEYGKPNSIVDGIGRLFSIPSKIILWDRRVDNHSISDETLLKLKIYLMTNGLEEVKVRVNQYDPIGELKRTVDNLSIGIIWRYTGGLVTWLYYTLLPGRIFGGDNYNPFSHTINLYSDVPEIALHEGAHAKDFTNRKYRGTYAFLGLIPVSYTHLTLPTIYSV